MGAQPKPIPLKPLLFLALALIAAIISLMQGRSLPPALASVGCIILAYYAFKIE